MNNVINSRRAAELIRGSKGKLFGVTFLKRTDGTVRDMVARTRRLPNGNPTYNAAEHGLLRVFEFVSERQTRPNPKPNLMEPMECTDTQWRSVPIGGISELRMGGERYIVRD